VKDRELVTGRGFRVGSSGINWEPATGNWQLHLE
jgi:hypothetical protein